MPTIRNYSLYLVITECFPTYVKMEKPCVSCALYLKCRVARTHLHLPAQLLGQRRVTYCQLRSQLAWVRENVVSVRTSFLVVCNTAKKLLSHAIDRSVQHLYLIYIEPVTYRSSVRLEAEQLSSRFGGSTVAQS